MLCHLRLLHMISRRRSVLLHRLCMCRDIITLGDLVEESAEAAHGVDRGYKVHVVCGNDRGEDAKEEDVGE